MSGKRLEKLNLTKLITTQHQRLYNILLKTIQSRKRTEKQNKYHYQIHQLIGLCSDIQKKTTLCMPQQTVNKHETKIQQK